MDDIDIVNRYSRQMLVPQVGGMAGQSALLSASVIIVGGSCYDRIQFLKAIH